MFPPAEIEKLLSGIIPSAPSGGIFEAYEMQGKRCRYPLQAVLHRQGGGVLRGIYFILKKIH